MPLYDFRCTEETCNAIFERFAGYEHRECECTKCGGQATRIMSIGRSAYRTDATWLESVLDVVNKDDKCPETKAFLADPSRHNYHAWMKAKGLRPMSENEFRNPHKEEALDWVQKQRTHVLLKQKRERETIHVRR